MELSRNLPETFKLIQFIQHNKISILLFDKAHLSNITTLKIQNFLFYFTYCLLVTGNWSFKSIATFVHTKPTHLPLTKHITYLEYTIIHIKTSQPKLRLVVANKKPCHLLLTSDLDMLLNTTAYPIIIGDLHSKHQSRRSQHTNPSNTILAQYVDTRMDITIIVINSFLNNRSFRTKNYNILSSSKPVLLGVP